LGHGTAAFADLVEERAVGQRIHSGGVCEIGWGDGLLPGVRAAAVAIVAVTARAIFLVERASGVDDLRGRWDRILAAGGFVGNDPCGSVSQAQNDGDNNHPKKSDEEEPAQLAGFLRVHV